MGSNQNTTFLKKIVFAGIKVDTSPSERRHITFINICSIIAILAVLSFCTFDSFIAFHYLRLPIFISLGYIPLFILTPYFNYKYRYLLARVLLMLSAFSLTFIIAGLFLGKKAGEHYLFMLFAVIPFSMNPIRHWKLVSFFVLICIIGFFYVEFYATQDKVLTPFPIEFLYSYKIFGILLCFFLFLAILILYEVQITNRENLIQTQTVKLQEINESLTEINNDITRNLDLLKEINSSKDLLFSIIAHDLRGPIGNIMATSEVLTESLRVNDQDSINILSTSIRTSSKETFSLLEDLLTWSKMQIGTVQPKIQKLFLAELLKSQVDFFSDWTRQKGVELKIENIDFSVFADYDMFGIILKNIISNAIKFSYSGGKINIAGEVTGKLASLKISDTGIGIHEEILKNLFRLDKIKSLAGTAGEKGTGLGLILCNELIKKLNGNINIETKYGEGTTFIITVPACS